MKYIREFIKYLYYKIKLKKKKFFIQRGSKVKGALIEGGGHLGKNSNLSNSIIGYGTYFGFNCQLENSKIGKYCSFGSNIRVLRGNHPTRNYVSTSPAFHSSSLKKEGIYYKNYKEFSTLTKTENGFSVEIGNDVWIGDNVLIIGDITIGNGAIIGAGSVITKDISPYSVWGGYLLRR